MAQKRTTPVAWRNNDPNEGPVTEAPTIFTLVTATPKLSHRLNMKPATNRNGANAKFRAFSDQTRLRILHLLRAGELCVNDLVEIIDVPQPTASRHLAYLRRAELVVTRKDGQWTYYALAPARNVFQQKLMDCLSQCFDEVPAIQKDAVRAAKLKKRGGCCPR